MKLKNVFIPFALAVGLMAAHAPAVAGFVAVPDTGTPLVNCNPKAANGSQSATLTTCKVTSLPNGGDPEMAGYVATPIRTSGPNNITINGKVVGQSWDRVYCKGSGSTCATTGADAYVFLVATRVRMSNTASAGNANCPVWSGTTSSCFEINNFFRAINSGSPAVATSIAYYMGPAGSTNDTDPNLALAKKYLEKGGKTFKGLNQYSGSNGVAADYNATRIMFQADTNTFDPDQTAVSPSSRWSPWLFVRQTCTPPKAYTTTQAVQKIRYWQGGEEGQPNQLIDASGYACQ